MDIQIVLSYSLIFNEKYSYTVQKKSVVEGMKPVMCIHEYKIYVALKWPHGLLYYLFMIMNI